MQGCPLSLDLSPSRRQGALQCRDLDLRSQLWSHDTSPGIMTFVHFSLGFSIVHPGGLTLPGGEGNLHVNITTYETGIHTMSLKIMKINK